MLMLKSQIFAKELNLIIRKQECEKKKKVGNIKKANEKGKNSGQYIKCTKKK